MKKLLAVDPLCEPGHVNSNKYFLNILENNYKVTFASSSDYINSLGVENYIEIPKKSKTRRLSKIGFRISQIRVINYVRKLVKIKKYDIILFLAYDTISFSIMSHFFPKNARIYLFDHNNIDHLLNSTVKEMFFKSIRKKTIHLTYENYITEFIKNRYGVSSKTIFHPFYTNSKLNKKENNSIRFKKKVIFAPSGSSDEKVIERLIHYVNNRDDIYLVTKSKRGINSDRVLAKPFFDDYNKQMSGCDFVFIAAKFKFRVSGIFYEAMSFGKKIVMVDSLFAREMKKSYPSSVFVIEEVSEIQEILYLNENSINESLSFLGEHSKDKILKMLISAFSD